MSYEPRWLLVEPLNLCILVMPKCGALTVYGAIEKKLTGKIPSNPARIAEDNPNDCSFVWQQEFLKRVDIEKICVTRDPVDRFKSLWKNKCRDKTNGVPEELWGITPTRLYEHIKKDIYSNPHWSPQCDWEGGIADSLVPIERFEQWWGEEVKHWNATLGPVDVDDDAIRDLYAGDFILHQRALRSFSRYYHNNHVAN